MCSAAMVKIGPYHTFKIISLLIEICYGAKVGLNIPPKNIMELCSIYCLISCGLLFSPDYQIHHDFNNALDNLTISWIRVDRVTTRYFPTVGKVIMLNFNNFIADLVSVYAEKCQQCKLGIIPFVPTPDI